MVLVQPWCSCFVLLIPELPGGVKRIHNLLKRYRFPSGRPAAKAPIPITGLPSTPIGGLCSWVRLAWERHPTSTILRARTCDHSPLRDDAAVDIAHALHPAQRHGHVELARQNVDRGGDPRLAPGAEAVDIGAPNHAGARAVGERAHHVLAGADAAVDHHLDHV